MLRSRLSWAAWYVLPMLFCLAVHWTALKTWFAADDFAWLKLPLGLQSSSDWLEAFFAPRAQGTIRTLSERLYFIVFAFLFGLHALPFRIWQFLTAFADLALLGWIAKRLTGSVWAGFCAPLLWAVNASLSIALDFSAAYNEVCCAFFLLLAFFCLLRFLDTGRRGYWIAQWAAFLLGFGALELIVVYPALAALYTFLFARRAFRRTLWLFIPSVLFTLFHFLYVPAAHDPAYAMTFNAGMLTMLWRYWAFAVGAYRPKAEDWRPVWLGLAAALAGLAGAIWLLRKQPRMTLFCLAWFGLVLAPLLPLQNHFTEYYNTMPALGLALLGALALARYPRAAVPFLLFYAVLSYSDIRVAERFFYQRALPMKRLLEGLQADRQINQNKAIILAGITNQTFAAGFYDDPFPLVGSARVFLAPGTEQGIDAHPEWGGISQYVIAPESALDLLRNGKAEVYEVSSGPLARITQRYRAIAMSQFAATHRDRVDVGDPAHAALLGEGWYPVEDNSRWMGKRATVQLSPPPHAEGILTVTGYCPAQVILQGPVVLTVFAGGDKVGSLSLRSAGAFEVSSRVPASHLSGSEIPVAVEVNRTSRIGGDVRPLGLIFGTFRMR